MAKVKHLKISNASYDIDPMSHASTTTTYGGGNSSNYGHVKLSDTYNSNVGGASSSLGASQTAVYNTYKTFYDRLPITHSNGVNSVTATNSLQVLMPSKVITRTNILVCGRLAFNKGTNDGYYVELQSSTNNSTWTTQAGFYYYPNGALDVLTFCVPINVSSNKWYLRAVIKLSSGTASSPTVNTTASVSTINYVDL